MVDDHSFTITHEWVVDLSDGSESLGFRINDHTYAVHNLCVVDGKKLPLNRNKFAAVVTSLKG